MPSDSPEAHMQRRSAPSHLLDTTSDPLAGASSGRLCWAVNVREWEPEKDELEFLLSLIPSKSERATVREMESAKAMKEGIVSRLMTHRACAAVLGSTCFDNIAIERTPFGKPFLKRPRPPWGNSGALANFNFNISHHQDWVVLASDPLCICGIDVASPDVCYADGMNDTWLTDRERDDAMKESTSRGSTYKAEHFQRIWTCKEAFTKARGDGMRFNFLDLEFRLFEDHEAELGPGAWRYTAKASVCGQAEPLWAIHQQRIDADHWVTVARGPTSAAADCDDEFFATLRRRTEGFSRAEWKSVMREPLPPLSKVPVSFLVPEDDVEEYARCLEYGIQTVD